LLAQVRDKIIVNKLTILIFAWIVMVNSILGLEQTEKQLQCCPSLKLWISWSAITTAMEMSSFDASYREESTDLFKSCTAIMGRVRDCFDLEHADGLHAWQISSDHHRNVVNSSYNNNKTCSLPSWFRICCWNIWNRKNLVVG
jgi:hypothetical protein